MNCHFTECTHYADCPDISIFVVLWPSFRQTFLLTLTGTIHTIYHIPYILQSMPSNYLTHLTQRNQACFLRRIVFISFMLPTALNYFRSKLLFTARCSTAVGYCGEVGWEKVASWSTKAAIGLLSLKRVKIEEKLL